MRIRIASVFVADQAQALEFYTNVLGFKKKEDLPLGEHRWLTVVSPEGPDELELLLEPNVHQAAALFQKSMFDDGIAATLFFVDDIAAEHDRLTGLGVRFTTQPMEAGPVKIAVFDDTCGNLIQLVQQ